MARYLGPKHKICKRFGVPLCGSQNCPVLRLTKAPKRNVTGRRRNRIGGKRSDYGVQLLEKQKAKAIYGVLERQFRKYFAKATRQKGTTGETLLQLLETRLDNVVYRLGFANTRRAARQLVSHGRVLVNDKKVTIPSYQVRLGDVVTLTPGALANPQVGQSLKLSKNGQIPTWLKRQGPVGQIVRKPERTEIGEPIVEHLIVEYYSR